MPNALQIDENLVPGSTYTFTFSLDNKFFLAKEAELVQDLADFGPDFLQFVTVSKSEVGILTTYYNVTFAYSGPGADGSDVIGDVITAMVIAFKKGSNDDFTFVQASSNSTGVTLSTTAADAATAASAALVAAGATVGQTLGAASTPLVKPILSLSWLLVVVAVLGAMFLILKAGGLKAVGLTKAAHKGR